MTDSRQSTGEASATRVRTRRRNHELLLALVMLLGLSSIVALARWMEKQPKPASMLKQNEQLYVSPHVARRMSLGFNGLVADWYWMRSLQYVGRKALEHNGPLQLDDLSPLALSQLAPLLDHTTTLDPKFMAAYEYGAVVLPAVDVEAAVKLLRKGIAENPREWRLYNHLGYIYWQRGRFREASEAYSEGARVPGAQPWMKVMAAQMETNGGSREVARDIYNRMLQEADDEKVKQLALSRLLQLDSLDQRDLLKRILTEVKARTGRCPAAWGETAMLMRRARCKLDPTGAPLDPVDMPYLLDSNSCEARLNPRSPIPQN